MQHLETLYEAKCTTRWGYTLTFETFAVTYATYVYAECNSLTRCQGATFCMAWHRKKLLQRSWWVFLQYQFFFVIARFFPLSGGKIHFVPEKNDIYPEKISQKNDIYWEGKCTEVIAQLQVADLAVCQKETPDFFSRFSWEVQDFFMEKLDFSRQNFLANLRGKTGPDPSGTASPPLRPSPPGASVLREAPDDTRRGLIPFSTSAKIWPMLKQTLARKNTCLPAHEFTHFCGLNLRWTSNSSANASKKWQGKRKLAAFR